MEWGSYLCRGMMKTASKSTQEPRLSDPAHQALMLRLQRCLMHFGMTPFSSRVLMQHMMSCLAKSEHDSNHSIGRIVTYLLHLLNPKPRMEVAGLDRRGCPQIIPDLRSKPFWTSSDIPSIQLLESNFVSIRQEFLALREYKHSFQCYRSGDATKESTDRGSWHVCYLSLHGMDFSDNAVACPITMQTISSLPRPYHHALFSALDKDTHVAAHYGPTNKKLRCFLPLIVPKDCNNQQYCWLQVNGEKVYLEEGKCLVFDDSFYHEAANESLNIPRIVLIVDIWHPDLTDAEVKILEFINKAQINAAKRIAKMAQQQQAEELSNGVHNNSNNGDFFSAIQKSYQEGISEEGAVRIWGQYQSKHHS